jgi:hypothetical protein
MTILDAIFFLNHTALNILNHASVEAKERLHKDYIAEINYSRDIYMALACYYEANSLLSKEQSGAAIGYYRKAKVFFIYDDDVMYMMQYIYI